MVAGRLTAAGTQPRRRRGRLGRRRCAREGFGHIGGGGGGRRGRRGGSPGCGGVVRRVFYCDGSVLLLFSLGKVQQKSEFNSSTLMGLMLVVTQ